MKNKCLIFCLPSLISGSLNYLFVFLLFQELFVCAAWFAFPRKLQIAGCWRSCCFVTLPSAGIAGRVAWHALWIWGVQVATPSWKFSLKLTWRLKPPIGAFYIVVAMHWICVSWRRFCPSHFFVEARWGFICVKKQIWAEDSEFQRFSSS